MQKCNMDCLNCIYPDCILTDADNSNYSYYGTHLEQCKEYRRRYYQKHRDEINAKCKKYYADHKEEYATKYRAKRAEERKTSPQYYQH